jgi:hypothetical protein
MSDRLQELLHQKALLAEHAAWLEREIAIERDLTGVIPAAAAPASPAPPPALPAPSADTEAETLLNQYRTNPQSIRRDVTRGCILYFLGALVLMGLGVLAIYLVYRHR